MKYYIIKDLISNEYYNTDYIISNGQHFLTVPDFSNPLKLPHYFEYKEKAQKTVNEWNAKDNSVVLIIITIYL